MDWLERFVSTKFLLTAFCLTAAFVLVGLGKDIGGLEILVPAILAFYIGGNVSQDIFKTQIQAKYNTPPADSTKETSAGSGP